MIKPETDLELSIKALEVYDVAPYLIENMLTNLQKILNPKAMMNKKFFMVLVEGKNTPTVQYDNLDKAEKEAKRLADKYGKKAFVLESTSLITPGEINVKVDSFEAALEYLGRENIVWLHGMPDKHAKAMVSMYKLITIAEAWNKADDFIPDFSNRNQYKYFPRFVYNDKFAGFSYSYSNYSPSRANAHIGSRLCFKTEERAEQFGKQFIDLWNDFLLFR